MNQTCLRAPVATSGGAHRGCGLPADLGRTCPSSR